MTFAPGTIKAVGYDDAGKVIGQDTQQTAGAPAAVRLLAEDKSLTGGFDSVGFVRAEVVDAKGIVVPSAAVPVTVNVGGAGALAALDNGDNTDHTMFSGPTRTTYQGRALVMVKAKAAGTISIDATAPGLKADHATLKAN